MLLVFFDLYLFISFTNLLLIPATYTLLVLCYYSIAVDDRDLAAARATGESFCLAVVAVLILSLLLNC